MAETIRMDYHNRVFAEYRRIGSECGTHAYGIPDMDRQQLPVRDLFYRCMAEMVDRQTFRRMEARADVSGFFRHRNVGMV
jgi:hypothetical protein